MDNLKFCEIGLNHFTIKGNFEYLKHCEKSVIVDGEQYTKEWNELAIMDIDSIPDSKFTTHEIDFKFFGIKYKIKDCHSFSIPFTELYRKYRHPISSTNHTVSLIQLLWNEGKLDKRILDIYIDKGEIYSREIKDRIKKETVLPILICAYGFNNYLYADIHLKDFLSIEKKGINIPYYREYDEAFSHLGLNLSDGLTFNNAQKILLIKTKQL